MSSINEFLPARDEYIARVKAELLGPGSELSIPDAEHELITNSPDVRYSIGILFPKNNKLNADNNDPSRVEESSEPSEDLSDEEEETADDEKEKTDPVTPAEEENLDEEISLAAQNMPSSLGLTFLASSNPQVLKCEVAFATYRKAKMSDCRIPFYPDSPEKYSVPTQLSSYVVYDSEEKCLKLCTGLNRKTVHDLYERDFLDGEEYGIFPAMYKLCDQLKGGYVRVPHNVEAVVDFSSGDYVDDNKRLDETSAKITALKRKINEHLYSVTIMLVNDDEEKSNGTRCLFQPVIKIESEMNGFRFCEYSSLVDFNVLDSEEQSLELQYRNKRVYGTGLGTSVNWEIDTEGNGIIYNDFFPETEVPQMDFTIPKSFGIKAEALSMRHLSDLDRTEKSQKLSELRSVVEAYGSWIDALVEKQKDLPAHYQSAASINISGCLKAKDRMLAGLRVLDEDAVAWTAFSLANRAMFMQRVHLKLQSDTGNIDRYSNQLCREYGLSFTESKADPFRIPAWKKRLCRTIKEAMENCATREEFIAFMAEYGYKVRWEPNQKYITYTTPENVRCRDNKLFDQTLLRSSMEAYFDMGGCEYLESRIDATEYGELLPTVDDAVCGLISILDAMNTGDNDRFHLETLHHSKQEIRRILERGGKIDRTVEYAVDDEDEEYEQYHGFSMRM